MAHIIWVRPKLGLKLLVKKVEGFTLYNNFIIPTKTLTLLKFEENGSHSIKTLVIGNWKCHWLWAHQQKTSANFHNSIKINLLNFGVSIKFWSEVLRASEKQLLSQKRPTLWKIGIKIRVKWHPDLHSPVLRIYLSFSKSPNKALYISWRIKNVLVSHISLNYL